MAIYAIIYVVLLLGIFYLLNIGRELFTTNTPNFIQMDNAEFHGINMLGDNSDDGHFATDSPIECQEICQRNPECYGYSYYAPGQRCYMFTSGDFVAGRSGFQSGKKITSL
jgi:hypothetical protein